MSTTKVTHKSKLKNKDEGLHCMWNDGKNVTFCGVDFEDSTEEETDLSVNDISCPLCQVFLAGYMAGVYK